MTLIVVGIPILLNIVLLILFYIHIKKYKTREEKINNNIKILSRNDSVISNEINKIISLQQQINNLLNNIHSSIKSLGDTSKVSELMSKLHNSNNLNIKLLNEIKFMKQEIKENIKSVKEQ